MASNPYTSPVVDGKPSALLAIIFRILYGLSYPFLALSALLLGATIFPMAFVSQFTIANDSPESIIVTPIGTIGRKGFRRPLPMISTNFPHRMSSQRGGYLLAPDEKIDLAYDMDDINFSEIVVESKSGEKTQIVVNPNPTANQYTSPSKTLFNISDPAALPQVPTNVRDATIVASKPNPGIWKIKAFIVTPWLVFAMLHFTKRAIMRESATLAEHPSAT